MSILKTLGDMDGKPILYAVMIGSMVIGIPYLLYEANKVKTTVLDCSKSYGDTATIHWRSRDDGSCHIEDFCNTIPGRCTYSDEPKS